MPGIKKTMDEWKSGTLKSSSGQKVTNQKQAVAIGLSEQRKARGGQENLQKEIDAEWSVFSIR